MYSYLRCRKYLEPIKRKNRRKAVFFCLLKVGRSPQILVANGNVICMQGA
jgi:hypothetical protein